MRDYLYVAHITDTHLFSAADGTLFDVVTERTLRAVLADIQQQPEALDMVLVTGDLVHDETAAGYERLRTLLTPLGVPWLCLPGNHDDLNLMRSILQCDVPVCAPAPRGGRWRFGMLNSSVPGMVGGRFSDAHQGALRSWLAANPAAWFVLCLHHQPVPVGTAWLDRIGLDQAGSFVDLIETHPQVKAVMWGHVHQAFAAQRGAAQLLATPSTCAQFLPGAAEFALDPGRPPGWRWLKLYDDGRVQSEVRWVA